MQCLTIAIFFCHMQPFHPCKTSSGSFPFPLTQIYPLSLRYRDIALDILSCSPASLKDSTHFFSPSHLFSLKKCIALFLLPGTTTAKSALSNEYLHKPLICLMFQLFESFLNKYWIPFESTENSRT